jgi:hypothetical protein
VDGLSALKDCPGSEQAAACGSECGALTAADRSNRRARRNGTAGPVARVAALRKRREQVTDFLDGAAADASGAPNVNTTTPPAKDPPGRERGI